MPRGNKSVPTSNEMAIGNYIIGETLGQGTFAKVKLGIHKSTNVEVAVKIVNREKVKQQDVAGKLRREIQNLWLFRHPHIIKLYQVISTPTDIFIIMEYAPGGELFDYIVKAGKLTETDSRRFFQQIISGIAYCHRHKVVHRDLKPENLLLDAQQNVKIADFGLSNMMVDGEFLRTSCGSPNYAAPEVISSRLYAGPEVDVWSCGVILYAFIFGVLPFDDDDMPQLFRKIRTGEYRLPAYHNSELRDLIRRMLVIDSVKRITMEEIRQHAWFVQDLPPYLFPDDQDEDACLIDKDVIYQVCEALKVSEREVLSSLITRDHSHQYCVAYNLIMDKKRKTGQIPSTKDIHHSAATAAAARGDSSPIESAEMKIPNICYIFPREDAAAASTHSESSTQQQQQRFRNASLTGSSTCGGTAGGGGGGGGAAVSHASHPSPSSSSGMSAASPAGTTAPPLIHPEQMPALYGLSRTLDEMPQPTGAASGAAGAAGASPGNLDDVTSWPPPVNQPAQNRYKWHLGIRSASKSWDIIMEVFKAMKSLNYEWKLLQPFTIRVRKFHPAPRSFYSKMMLQLYQLDQRSFLLDFKCIDERPHPESDPMNSRRRSSGIFGTDVFGNSPHSKMPTGIKSLGELTEEEGSAVAGGVADDMECSDENTNRHFTMEFFEMCAELITALSR